MQELKNPCKIKAFSLLKGGIPQKALCSKEFEYFPVLGRKKRVGEKMGRTRGENYSIECR